MQQIIRTTQGKTPVLSCIEIRTQNGHPPRPWLQDLWLSILLVGPVAAPLFVWSGVPALRPFADGIYLLGDVVCPKPDEHFMLLGYPMAVCASCWFAVFGLWTVRLLYGRAGEGIGLLSRLDLAPLWLRWAAASILTKLSVLCVGFLPWAFDAMLWDSGLWASPPSFMMLVGYLGGISAGMLLFPAASQMRARNAKREA